MATEDDLESLIGRIPACTLHSPRAPDLRCCCGRTDCAYLRHNCLALDDLEKEVRTAAQLGQALLVRHEQYMQDAERDRNEMTAKIEKLEADKKELESQNAKTIEENRGLLDQLESVNGTLTESEIHVKSLEATLHATRQELRRLEGLASRTRDLEVQMAQLELEQELLQKTVATTQEEERCAVQRWRKAERSLTDLHDQLERIEREAREEREKHVEVMGRMERQRAVERELDTAAGRLKGAAAATANGKHGSSVVSHFVKDILQDNANLQMGIVELREMLMNSNDEVQMLREQLLMHQPVVERKEDGSAPSTLRAELATKDPAETKEEKTEPQVVSQALHIHHHYHAPKKAEIRPKKKRTSLNTALFTPPRHMQSPRTSRDVASAILSQTSVTVPSPITPTNRWSVQSGQMSDFAPSSVPSSPQSYRNSNLFDRGYDFDSSRPTSPGSSVDPMSPQFQPQYHKKRGSDVSGRNFPAPLNFRSHVIHEEEDGDVEELPDLQAPSIPSLDNGTTPSDVSHKAESDAHDHQWTSSFQPSLRRTSSHESILSISGIDIHTLKSRPSQMTITGDSLHFRPQTRLGTPSSIVSVETMTSASMITARPTLSRQGHNSTSYLRSTVLANSSDARSISSSGSNESSHPRTGGWLFSRWGVSPAKSTAVLRGPPLATPPKQRVVSTPVDPLRAFMGRPPGINQKGPIPGFIKKAEKAPSKVTTELVDHDALQEVLMEA
ncbi:uncharacterized protein PAC_03150 [Phialocephala subalpina]|uniref:Uncharacterized protein n=1 Tax=Phialocephala subalpina TaxID=576137 RepID=A0A1L7WKG7_9HELO|nr:uncharacterized protein PAC_03150 [Phialocephala subalpina]